MATKQLPHSDRGALVLSILVIQFWQKSNPLKLMCNIM